MKLNYQTPLFLYNLDIVEERIRGLKKYLSKDINLYYAIKANPNLTLLHFLKDKVDGADISSGGELQLLLKAKFNQNIISFAGPGKTEKEIELAIKKNIKVISIESLTELVRVEKIAKKLNKKAKIALRINPDKIFNKFALKMGGRASQFGVEENEIDKFFKLLGKLKNCRIIGIHVFSGTQCLDEDTILENIANTLKIAKRIIEKYFLKLDFINLGGGFGVPYYEGQKALDAKKLVLSINNLFEQFKKEVNLPKIEAILELGRYLVAESGMYIVKVLNYKKSKGKDFYIVDGGMHHHLAASGNLGQIIRRNFKIINLSKKIAGKKIECTIAGCLCAPLDILADRIKIVKPEVGDYLAILDSGAYIYTASPVLFLSHNLPQELFLRKGKSYRR